MMLCGNVRGLRGCKRGCVAIPASLKAEVNTKNSSLCHTCGFRQVSILRIWVPVFVPAAELVAWCVPKGATSVVEAKVPNKGRALRDAPYLVTPGLATLLDVSDAKLRSADQLATLRQGPLPDPSVRPRGQAAGVVK